jgi:hypothetical protein
VQSRVASEPPAGTLPLVWQEALTQARPRADSWMGLGGGISSRLSSMPVQIAMPGAGPNPLWQLELASGQGGVAYSPQRLVLSFDTPALSVNDGRSRLHLGELHFGLLFHPGPEGSYDGLPNYDLSLGAGRLRLGDDDAAWLAADSLRISASQNSTLHRLDNLLRVRMDAARWQAVELGGLDLHLTALDWHRPTVLRIIEDLQDARSAALDPEVRTGLVLGILFEALQHLALHDPSIRGELRLEKDLERRLSAHLDMALRSDAEALSRSPLEALLLHLDLELERGLIDELQALLRQAALLDEDDPEAVRRWLDQGVSEGCRLFINGEDQTVLLLALLFGFARGMF